MDRWAVTLKKEFELFINVAHFDLSDSFFAKLIEFYSNYKSFYTEQHFNTISLLAMTEYQAKSIVGRAPHSIAEEVFLDELLILLEHFKENEDKKESFLRMSNFKLPEPTKPQQLWLEYINLKKILYSENPI